MKYVSLMSAMGFVLIVSGVVFSGDPIGTATQQPTELPPVTGDYLGLSPPGLEPEVFSPNHISKRDRGEFRVSFSPDAEQIYYSISPSPVLGSVNLYGIEYTIREDDEWGGLEKVIFEGSDQGVDFLEPFVSPDGQALYFTTNLPPVADSDDYNLAVAHRTADGWGDVEILPEPVNSSASEWYPSLTTRGTLYFSSWRDSGFGGGDIYQARLENGIYTVENLGETINSTSNDADAYIDPDERFIIFFSNRSGGEGGSDLYISIQDEDERWSTPANLGPPINSTYDEFAPSISPDGRYFFFMRDGDIYWVDIQALASLMPAS
jgi:Tol biopolymer transport system component